MVGILWCRFFWWSQKYTLSWCNFLALFQNEPKVSYFFCYFEMIFIVIEVLFYGYFTVIWGIVFILILKLSLLPWTLENKTHSKCTCRGDNQVHPIFSRSQQPESCFQSGEQRVWDWDVSIATCAHSRPGDKSPDPSVWMCDHMFVILGTDRFFISPWQTTKAVAQSRPPTCDQGGAYCHSFSGSARGFLRRGTLDIALFVAAFH